MKQKISKNIIYIKLILVAIFFGSTFIAGRITAATVPPFTAAFLRFLIASVFLIWFTYHKYGSLPHLDLKLGFLVVLLGLSGMAAYNFFFFSGLKIVTASRSAVIIALNPVFIAIFSRIIFKEEFNSYKIAGIIIALTGALTVITHGNLSGILSEGLGRGEMLILGCVVCWVVFTLLGKIVMQKLPPLVAITYGSIAGTILLFGPAVNEGVLGEISAYGIDIWLSLFLLGFIATALAFTWFYEGIDSIGPSRAGVFLSFVPLFAAVMAVAVLHETLDSAFLIGIVLVVSGVYLTNRKHNKTDLKANEALNGDYHQGKSLGDIPK